MRDYSDLSPNSKKLLDAILMEFAGSAGVTDYMTEAEALEAMHTLLDVGVIRLESDGEEVRLILPEPVTLQ